MTASAWPRAEQRFAKTVLRGHDRLCELFVLAKRRDQAEDDRYVSNVRRRYANVRGYHWRTARFD